MELSRFFYREAGTYSPTRLLSLSKYQEGHAQVMIDVIYVVVLQWFMIFFTCFLNFSFSIPFF